jgi:RNA methyltransferase, TrmH family
LTDALGAHNAEVKRLRALLRDREARVHEGAFVLEGPRVVEGAIEREVALQALYLGPDGDRAFAPLVARVRERGTPVALLREGVLEKIGHTRTPQPVLAVAATIRRPFAVPAVSGVLVVGVGIADPGNLGTILRSAEAAGAAGVVLCDNSVDPENPKVVRSSAGAVFGLPVMEARSVMDVLDALGAGGWRCVGAAVGEGVPYDSADLTGSCALVVGNEAHGLPATVGAQLDSLVTIPMSAAAESLNVAMATSVLLFESARQTRHARAPR